ncbi:MAG: DegT/DnrJ/EryC1/StrS family aminotransferase, partial [Methanococcaceae archaeon]
YQHSTVGYNYRMSNVRAGIGRGQLEVLDDRIKSRQDNNAFYRDLLRSFDFVSFQNEPDPVFSNYWLTAILIEKNNYNINAQKMMLQMGLYNIETRPLWKPMHLQPVFSGCPKYLNGLSEQMFNKGLVLPSGSNLSADDKTRIKNCLINSIQG